MAEEQNPRVGEKDLPLVTSMSEMKYVRGLNQNNDSVRIAKENLVLPAAQTTEMAAAIALAEGFATDAETAKTGAETAQGITEGFRDETEAFKNAAANSVAAIGNNVTDFGAVGDGVTDDTTDVQTTIDAGNRVLIPTGKFKITALTNLLGVDFEGIGSLMLPKNLKANSKYSKPKEPIVFGLEYLAAFHKKCMAFEPPLFVNASTKLKVYLSGDSTTAGVGIVDSDYTLNNLLSTLSINSGIPFIDYVNKGHSGYMTSEWIAEYLNGEIADNPDLFILRWGINDGKYGYISDGVFNKTLSERIDNFITNMRSALTSIRARSVDDLSIILMAPNSTSDYLGGRDEEWYEAIIPAIKQMARDFQCCFINTYQIAQDSRNATGYMDSPYTDDRHIHPIDVMNLWIISELFDTILPTALRIKLSDSNLINEHVKSVIRNIADLPTAYAFGVSMSRFQDTGYDGAVYTQKHTTGIALQIYTSYNPAIPNLKYRISGDGETWGSFLPIQDMTDIFANIPGSTATKASTDAPSTYPKGLSMYRAVTGFPRNGAVYTLYHIDSIVLQFNVDYDTASLKLSARVGDDTTWSPWVALVN